MKAQLNIDFILAVTLFIIAILFVSYIAIQTQSSLKTEIDNEQKRLIGYAISQLLLLDTGYPTNWSSLDNVQRFGLALSPYILSRDKINAIKNCSYENYTKMKNLFSLSTEREFLIIISDSSEKTITKCGIEHRLREIIWIKRFAILDGNIVKINLGIY
jgi:hypothetical protein